jgi:hypothetical protein
VSQTILKQQIIEVTLKNSLIDTFHNDINSIIKEFINDFELKYEGMEFGPSNPLLRWLDFTTRYIQPAKRKIFYSKNFKKQLDEAVEIALNKIESIIRNGGDINPYQSKGLIINNDTSGSKRQARTDLLFADWGVHHLHLSDSNPEPGKYFSKRSDWLIFCIFGENDARFIDIRRHKGHELFEDKEMLKSIADSWPEYMDRFKVKIMDSISALPNTPGEIKILRKSGVTSAVQINDSVYLPLGKGVTAASTSVISSEQLIRINTLVSSLANLFSGDESQYLKDLKGKGITKPDFHIALHKDGLCIHELESNQAYVLSRTKNTGSQCWISELHDLVLPEWAHVFLLKKGGVV